jgi:hypothetical protein
VPSLFSRKSATTEVPEVEPEATAASPDSRRPKGYTPGKGRATAKRGAAARRPTEAPPTNRREAYRRQRERNREERLYAMEQQRLGNDKYLPRRDQGAERALVRDIVDRRRTIGPWLLLIMLVVLFFFSNPALPVAVQIFGQSLLMVTLLATVLDCFLIGWRVRKEVRARFPQTQQRMSGMIFYAIMRGIQARRLRMPKPRKQIGDSLDD